MVVNEKPERRLYGRNPNPKPFRLTARDAEILLLLAERRLMDINEIQQSETRNKHVLHRRLNAMFHWGLVDRLKDEPHPGATRVPVVYTLTKDGKKVLDQLQTVLSENLTHQGEDLSRCLANIQNTTMMEQFREVLTLALQFKLSIDLLEWQERASPSRESFAYWKPRAEEPDAYLFPGESPAGLF